MKKSKNNKKHYLSLIIILLILGLSFGLSVFFPKTHDKKSFAEYNDKVFTIRKDVLDQYHLSLVYAYKSKIFQITNNTNSPTLIYDYIDDIPSFEMIKKGTYIIGHSTIFNQDESSIYSLSFDQYSRLNNHKSNYYSKINPKGGLNIFQDIYSDNPMIIGSIPASKLTHLECYENNQCDASKREASYLPSTNNSYLVSGYSAINKGPSIIPVYVTTCDGLKIYDVKFNLPDKSIAWLSDNRLLLGDGNKTRILTFNLDGSFKEEKVYIPSISKFDQTKVSPSGRYVVYAWNSVDIYDLQESKRVNISEIINQQVKSSYPSDQIDHIFWNSQFIGWSQDSSHMIISVSITSKQGKESEVQQLSKTTMIYSTESGEIDTLAYFGIDDNQAKSNTIQVDINNANELHPIFF